MNINGYIRRKKIACASYKRLHFWIIYTSISESFTQAFLSRAFWRTNKSRTTSQVIHPHTNACGLHPHYTFSVCGAHTRHTYVCGCVNGRASIFVRRTPWLPTFIKKHPKLNRVQRHTNIQSTQLFCTASVHEKTKETRISKFFFFLIYSDGEQLGSKTPTSDWETRNPKIAYL